ncbi:MAG: GGDEF domain-containing protein [Betaproteobacteria bacterium]|nr:GGDEF domain-containing protein [Betaproteobacteria bacterium]
MDTLPLLDVRTLFFVLIMLSLVLALSLWIGVGHRFRAGLGLWVISLLLQCVVFALFALRGRIGELWTVILPNGLFLVCITLKAAAIMQFYGQRMARSWHVLPPLVLMLLFALLLNHIGPRVLIGSIAYSAAQFALAWLSLHLATPATVQATRLMVIGLVIGALAFFARAMMALLSPQEVNDLLGPSQIQAVSFLLGLSVILMTSIGFLLLYKERAEDDAQRQAATDPLTDTFNRRMFLELGSKEVARSRRSLVPLSLIMMDLDHFKKVNDKYGHAAGDDVLRRFVDVTNICLRREDMLVRYGGEEFCVLLPEVSDLQAEALAERIRYAVEHAMFRWRDQAIPVTVSIGVASLRGEEDETLAELLQRADEALYAAKNGGRNRVVVCPENSTLAMLMRSRAE